ACECQQTSAQPPIINERLSVSNPPTMLPFYELQLAFLASFCVLFLLVERRLSRKSRSQNADASTVPSGVVSTLTRQYLIVYAIVMGECGLAPGAICVLTVSGAVCFPRTIRGIAFRHRFRFRWFDCTFVRREQFYFKRTKYNLTDSHLQWPQETLHAACACILVPYVPVLLFGRVLGGISTSILYSAFESWLISSSNSLALPQSDLSSIMGRATLVNGFVATAAGVASNQLVEVTGSFASPFIASGAVLLLGWVVIKGSWTENYGGGGGTASEDTFQLKRMGQAWKIVRAGSMYLFVFLWVPSLQEAALTTQVLPLGYIFSSFMVSMMLGSLLYTSVVSYYQPSELISAGGDSPLTLHAKLSSLVCAVSALAFAVSVSSGDEHVRFWAFCAFEACVGMYYPVQGMLRGTLISNEHRATLSSLFRVPLNVFVVVSLMTGVSSARYLASRRARSCWCSHRS
ncbi:Molybdate-anion transporter, partial [Grifola frondosa]